VEYASPEAVRRGGGRSRNRDGAGDADGLKRDGSRRERVRPKRKHEDEDDTVGDEEASSPPKRRKTDEAVEEAPHRVTRKRVEKEGKPKVRAKPGAALANAKRETIGIVPSQGKKIVF
jgi:hypothetical protein